MRLCEIHRAYNCQDETCKLMAQADQVLGVAYDDPGFDDLLPKEESAVAVAVEEKPVVDAVPVPPTLTLKVPTSKPAPAVKLTIKELPTSAPVANAVPVGP